ncbi:hypothetical protein NBRC3293_0666 [Gluconobacter oxydans NBRC 3293]|uniref:Uncharacterized protein n=1 Tax=Gluconobacter oxydans NBRC 3293 TaxID=1315969 RepID=A0A829X3D9_GLUOY|nr:hypothetical protein NBRC3293_0666 [Gluconobacter oxydans NBRC 3293]
MVSCEMSFFLMAVMRELLDHRVLPNTSGASVSPSGAD